MAETELMKSVYTKIKIFYYDDKWIDVTRYCINYQSNHQLNSPMKTFNIVFKSSFPKNPNDMYPHELFKIFLSNSQEWYADVVPGIAVNPSEQIGYSEDGKTENIIIQGFDLSYYFTKHKILYFTQLSSTVRQYMQRIMLDEIKANNASPYLLLRELINSQIFHDFSELPDGKKIENWLDIDTYMKDVNEDEKDASYILNGYAQFFMTQGFVWDVMKQYSNHMFNELYFRTIGNIDNAKSYLFFRRKPFSCEDFPSEWDNLLADYPPIEFSIDNEDVINSTLGRNGMEIYNFYLVYGTINQQSNTDMFARFGDVTSDYDIKIPILDEKSARKHGLRDLIATTPFIPCLKHDGDDVSYIKATAIFTQRIFEYYCLNDQFKSGHITILGGKPEAAIGLPFINRDDGLHYYCEGVKHLWQPGMFMTTCQLTRGMKPEDYKKKRNEKLEQVRT